MLQEKQITLKAIYGKQQGKLRISPVKDQITGRLKGVKDLSEEDRKKQVRPVTADTERVIQDNLILFLDNEVDKTDWNWIKECDEIASSFDEGQMNTKALYYVDQPSKELEDRLNRKQTKFEAESLIRNGSKNDRVEIARYLGQNVDSMTDSDLMDWMLSQLEIKGGPAKILKAKNDPNFKTRLFLFKLMDLNKIKKDRNGIFTYGELTLGLTVEAVVQWLNSKDNRDIVGKLYLELNAGDDAFIPSVIDEFESEKKPKKLLTDENKLGAAGEADDKTQKEVEIETL